MGHAVVHPAGPMHANANRGERKIRTSSKRARDKKDSTQSLLERPGVTSFAAVVCLVHRMNPLHFSIRDLQRVFPRLARGVHPHRAFVRELERGFPQQQSRTHPLRRVTSWRLVPRERAARDRREEKGDDKCRSDLPASNFEMGIVREKEVHVVAP